MTLALWPGTRMTGVEMGFINNIKLLGLQRRFQFLFDGLRDAHGILHVLYRPCALSGLIRATILRP